MKSLKLYKFRPTPTSVNFHFTRVCNYSCGFCFHNAKTGSKPSLEDAQRAIELLVQSGMKKLNFAGGEPMLYPSYLSALLKFTRLKYPKVALSIVSNGSKIRRQFLVDNAACIDILAISIDSFDYATNIAIGRSEGNERNMVSLERVAKIADWCRETNIMFKINTVVNALNWKEDMNMAIERLQPSRWKVFQVLILDNENGNQRSTEGNTRGNSGISLKVSSQQFNEFLNRHSNQSCIVPEPNDKMQNSYLILDENLRFLNCTSGSKIPGRSVLDVGVTVAMQDAGFDEEKFLERGGVYDWKRDGSLCDSSEISKALEW